MSEKSVFDPHAKEWDKPDRVKLASLVSGAIRERVELNREMTVLDYGAGTGLVTLDIGKDVKKIYAADSSEKMLSVLNEKLESLSIDNVEEIYTGDGDAELKTIKPDLIVSSMTLHHVDDYEELLGKFYEMLKTGGRIALADLDREDGDFHPDNMGVHHFGFDSEGLVESFKRAGFKDIKWDIIHSLRKKTAAGTGKSFRIFLISAFK